MPVIFCKGTAFKKTSESICCCRKYLYLCTHKTLRGGAEVARRAHNPKVASSNLAPATRKACKSFDLQAFVFWVVTRWKQIFHLFICL